MESLSSKENAGYLRDDNNATLGQPRDGNLRGGLCKKRQQTPRFRSMQVYIRSRGAEGGYSYLAVLLSDRPEGRIAYDCAAIDLGAGAERGVGTV